MKPVLFCMAAVAALGGCASTYQPQYSINEIVIVNNSREIIADVTIRSLDSGRVFACGNVAPLGICADRFPPRRLSDGPIQVEWNLGGQRGERTLPAEVPATFVTGLKIRGVLEFNSDGTVAGRFEQESPFR
jgi:hypothetical protein